jgi:hypothetical protein
LKARIEDIAQLVGNEIDADNRQKKGDAGEEADPVFARQKILVAIRD